MKNTQTVKNFVYNGRSHDLSSLEGCASLYSELSNLLALMSKNIEPDEKLKHVSEFDKRRYRVVRNPPSTYYVDCRIVPDFLDNDVGLKALLKMAMMSNFSNDRSHISKFIYGTDKNEYQVLRGINTDDYDRFDTFDCRFENRYSGTENEKRVIRHFGTKHGIIAYQKSPKVKKRKKLNREDTRNENNVFIRVLMNGPQFFNRPLIDPFTKTNIESIKLFNDIDEREYTINTYTLHHCIFVNATSIHKDGNEPSKALNTRSFTKFDITTILEFMGMVALGEDGHKIIHKTHYHDDIQGWFRRYMRGEVQWIPFHWKNERNYNQTVDWLVNHVSDLSKDDFPDYCRFINLLSFTIEHRSDIELAIGYSPESFTTFTYNVE